MFPQVDKLYCYYCLYASKVNKIKAFIMWVKSDILGFFFITFRKYREFERVVLGLSG